MTVKELLRGALRKTGIVVSGEDATAEEYADALLDLNSMLSAWAGEGYPIYASAVHNWTLTAGDADVTMGPTGTVTTIGRPIRIREAMARVGSTDYPVEVLGHESQYMTLTDKSSTGIPDRVFYRPDYPDGMLYLYPAPISGIDFHVRADVIFAEVTDYEADYALPQEIKEGIQWSLATRMNKELTGQDPSQHMVLMATAGYRAIERMGAMRILGVPVKSVTPFTRDRRGNYLFEGTT